MADGMNVDELLLGLASMGFEFEDCQSAVEAGNSTLESAVEWLISKKSHQSSDVSKPETSPEPVKEDMSQALPSQETSTSSDDMQSSTHLSSRYTVSEEHQKAKEQFMEKERENARMEAKRRKLMEKRARQDILQQIAEDKVNRRDRRLPKPTAHPTTSQTTVSGTTSSECLQNKKQCLLQIRGPTGVVRRETFSPDAKLEQVMSFISSQYRLTSDIYELLQPFPHRVFTITDMSSTLVELGLSPSGSLVVKKKDHMQTPAVTGTGHESAELDPVNLSTTTSGRELHRHENSDSNQPSHRNDDDNDVNNADEEQHDVAPPGFDRSPPPELDGFPDIPDPNVLGIGGLQNVMIAQGRGHVWGGGDILGAVGHNPHFIQPVLRAQNPGESAVRRLEMRQHQRLQSEPGPSHLIEEEVQPLLHRDVRRLEELCINHISYRLPGHQHPIASLGMLPHDLCDKILTHLMKNKTLAPKAMQAFISCGLRHVKLDCYPLVTNELLIALRLHRHLTHLSLRSCPLITDKAIEAVTVRSYEVTKNY